MEILVGTSGWSNPIWNPSGLSWYVDNSKLNAVELNMSFYQLPKKEQILSWAQEGNSLVWTVKMNRSVTHFFRFNEMAFEKFLEFQELFKPLDKQIEYYLFQLPPNAHPAMRDDIEKFFHQSQLGPRFALEWRNPHWYTKEHIQWAQSLGITVVSADSAQVPREIINTSGTVYLRLHGRSDWFLHHYSRKELSRITGAVLASGCRRVIAFLNNESLQLKNAQMLYQIFREQLNLTKIPADTK
ncbi:MAG: DUF72 domain-containing protein [Myxococcales bacterium]|nr:MAG: DUF72 domain-containing protein [Myxococcales bacterium]